MDTELKEEINIDLNEPVGNASKLSINNYLSNKGYAWLLEFEETDSNQSIM